MGEGVCTQTAGPLDRFSTRNAVPALSERISNNIRHVTGVTIPVTRPQSPSRASISRTMCPLPIPPRRSVYWQLKGLGVYPSKDCMSTLRFYLHLGSRGLSSLQRAPRLHMPRSLRGLRQLRKHQTRGAAESRLQE